MTEFSNIFPHSKWRKYTKTTTDATATTVTSISIAEEETTRILVEATARNSDGSINGAFYTRGTFYRNTSGNVTALSNQVNAPGTDATAASTIEVTLVANTTTQAVDIKVTGQTSKTIKWAVNVAHEKVQL